MTGSRLRHGSVGHRSRHGDDVHPQMAVAHMTMARISVAKLGWGYDGRTPFMTGYAEGRPDALLTIEEFENLHDVSGDRLELVRGRVVREPPAGGEHGLIGNNAAYFIRKYLEANAVGRCFNADTGFILRRGPDMVRAPDISFVCTERLPHVPAGYIPVAPDIAVEVVSPTDRFNDVQQKVRDYLEAGTVVVWLIQPRTRSLTIYRKGVTPSELHESEELTEDALLPGFKLQVASLFL